MTDMSIEEIKALINEHGSNFRGDATEYDRNCSCASCLSARTVIALRQLLKEREWKPIESAKDLCQADTEQGEGKGSAAERLPSGQADVGAEAWGRANLWLQVNWHDPSETQTTQSFMSAAGIEKRLAILPSVIAERSLHSKVTVTIRVFPMLPEMLQKQSQIEKRAHASADEVQRVERLPDTKFPSEAD